MGTLQVDALDGTPLAVDVWAGRRAPAFVLVHGLASNARLWDGVARQLHRDGEGHTVVALDQRGHGRSGRPDTGYDMASVADDLVAVLDALGLERPVAVGQSWGGNVVLEAAWRHPGRLAAAACVDGGVIELADRFPTWEACREALAPPPLEGVPAAAFEAELRRRHPDWPEEGVAGALANVERRPDGTIRPWLTRPRHLAVLRSLWEHRPSQRYPDLDLPVLLVPAAGAPSPWAADKRLAVDAALAALPRGRVRWVEGDHDLHAQQPGVVADLLLAFTQDLVAP